MVVQLQMVFLALHFMRTSLRNGSPVKANKALVSKSSSQLQQALIKVQTSQALLIQVQLRDTQTLQVGV
jgi:hypothetical protein